MVRKRVKKFWASLALLSAEVVVVTGLLIGAVVLFAYMVRRVFILQNNNFDESIFEALTPYHTETNNKIMTAITFLGKHEFLIPANIALILWFLLVRKRKWYSIRVPAVALSSLGLMFLLKNVFNRARPEVPLLEAARGLSFPSGHALMSVTFYGLLIYTVYHLWKNKTAKWAMITFLVILIILIGFSRIYLKVHYTSDVLAGFAMGLMWLFLSLWILENMERYSRRKLQPIVEQA
ncbi:MULTISPECIES: phosphatase PAP2 family protein [Chitinophagaceae]|uniref:phosphatase PAP2 family protein n=1 Tax=Chitinophagaceae TaxID=563835 RepID=UPI000DEF899E|nr:MULTISPECIES: phosphatase PAP2 family protein [Chitinophagaceae]RPD43839.1 phosphatase PAP2 family protein [Paracnuella aquatica]